MGYIFLTSLWHLLLLLTVIAAAFTTCVEGKSKPPNMIFFFPDTLRAESFNSYGNKVPNVTPNFKAFAESGVRFEQAHVMHTQCSPSRCTMMTGRYMHVLGHRTQIHLVRAYEENYWRLLKENGYHIAWYGKNDALSAAAFNLSVSEWENDIGYDSGHNAYNFGESGYWSMLSTGGEKLSNDTSQGDMRAVVKAIDFLNSDPPEPFAIFLPTRGAHPPYGPPKDFKDKWTIEEIKKYISLRPPNLKGKPKYHSNADGIRHYRNLTYLGDDTMYEIQKSYLEMISYTDYTFGVLLEGLKKSGFEENTAVFASSDHGDFGGDYGLVEKWPGGADDVLTRVPLFIRVPGGRKGYVSKAPVQTADIMETMIDLAGIETDFVRFAKSLLPVVKPGSHGHIEEDTKRFVFSEGGFYFRSELFPGGSDHVPNNPKGMYWPRAQEEMSNNGTGSPKWVMIRNLTAKLVYRPLGISELYDLTEDPRELKNLYKSDILYHKKLKEELQKQLMEWLVQTGDVPPLRNDYRGPPPFPSPITQNTCDELLQPNPDATANNLIAVNGIPFFQT